MLKKYPGVFAAGEMLNWDAPTGGFLIQGCVSQGYRAGRGILQLLEIDEKRSCDQQDGFSLESIPSPPRVLEFSTAQTSL